MTLSNAKGWAWWAVVDQFYGSRGSTKLTAFRTHSCKKLHSGRFSCGMSWRKKPYAFTGTVTMGNLNSRTGHFEFGFSLTRRNTRTHKSKRITVKY